MSYWVGFDLQSLPIQIFKNTIQNLLTLITLKMATLNLGVLWPFKFLMVCFDHWFKPSYYLGLTGFPLYATAWERPVVHMTTEARLPFLSQYGKG